MTSHERHDVSDHYIDVIMTTSGVSNHQPRDCLLKRLFRRRSRKTSKLRVTGLCAENSPGPVNSPHKGPVTWKMFPFDDWSGRVIRSPPLECVADGLGCLIKAGPSGDVIMSTTTHCLFILFKQQIMELQTPPVTGRFPLHSASYEYYIWRLYNLTAVYQKCQFSEVYM